MVLRVRVWKEDFMTAAAIQFTISAMPFGIQGFLTWLLARLLQSLSLFGIGKAIDKLIVHDSSMKPEPLMQMS